jgi:hypothetical protein
VQGVANNAWERAFVAGLASSQSKSFLNVQKCQIRMKPSSEYVENPNADIAVKCKGGPDFSNLNVAQATLVSHALQTSYNKVHTDIDDGDSDLADVFFHAGTDGGLSDAADTVAVVATTPRRRGYIWGGWAGDVGCRLCRSDDDAAVMLAGSNGAALTAWENEFVVALLQGSNADFHAVSSCDIKLTPHKKDADDESMVTEPLPVLELTASDSAAITMSKLM